jgi:hypothetical protein
MRQETAAAANRRVLRVLVLIGLFLFIGSILFIVSRAS